MERHWATSSDVVATFNLCTEERVDPTALVAEVKANGPRLLGLKKAKPEALDEYLAVAEAYARYRELLDEENVFDFATLQRAAYEMLRADDRVRGEVEDGRVHNEARADACQALAYFVTPFDVLPEEVHGAEGYVDQVYLCLVAIDRLRGELPEHVLEEAWEGEGDLAGLVDDALPKVEAALGVEAQAKILRYVGLGLEALTPAAHGRPAATR